MGEPVSEAYSIDPMDRYAQYLADPNLSEADRQMLLGLDDLALVEAGGGFKDDSDDSVVVKYQKAMRNAFADETNELAQFYVSRGFSAESFIQANDMVKLAEDLNKENEVRLVAEKDLKARKTAFIAKLMSLGSLSFMELMNLKTQAYMLADSVEDTLSRINTAIEAITAQKINTGADYVAFVGTGRGSSHFAVAA